MLVRTWITSNYSVPAMIITVISVLSSAVGLVAAVDDTDGENPLSWLMFIGPAVAGAFPTLELAWDRKHDLSRPTIVRRWFLFPTFGAAGAVIAMGVAEIMVRASGAMAAAQASDKWHFWFPADGPPVPSVLFGLLGYGAGLMLAVAVYVVVLWPLQILLRPRQAIEESMLDSSPEHFRRNRAALILMPILVLNAVVIGIVITQEIGWWLVVITVLLEVAMTVAVVRLQRSAASRGPGA